MKRSPLMLEQGDDKERMGYQLCRADLALLVPARYAHVAPLKLAGKLRRDTVIAVIPLLNFRLAIRFGNQRVIPQLYRVGFSTSEQASGAITILPSVSVSAWPASCQPSTLRAYSISACWNPPQVPRKGCYSHARNAPQ